MQFKTAILKWTLKQIIVINGHNLNAKHKERHLMENTFKDNYLGNKKGQSELHI